MAKHQVSKQTVIDLMRQIGLQDPIPEAQRILPDQVDPDSDGPKLASLGMSLDRVVDELGGGPW